LKAIDVPVHWNFNWIPERSTVASSIREKWPVDSRQWIVLQPGARWLNKRWPVDNYAALVRELAAGRPDVGFAILGGSADRELGAGIAQAAPERCLDLTGKISLPEMIEWIRLSSLMITNDTGPMHVAAALGKPVIAIFGPTEPRRTGPYRQLEHVLQLNLPCVPCLKPRCTYIKPFECLRAIPISAVFNPFHKRLDCHE